MSYEITDTIVILNAGRTESVRVSKTVSPAGDPATLYVFRDGRLTYFGSDPNRCNQINKLIAELMDDSTIVEEMNLFTNN